MEGQAGSVLGHAQRVCSAEFKESPTIISRTKLFDYIAERAANSLPFIMILVPIYWFLTRNLTRVIIKNQYVRIISYGLVPLSLIFLPGAWGQDRSSMIESILTTLIGLSLYCTLAFGFSAAISKHKTVRNRGDASPTQ